MPTSHVSFLLEGVSPLLMHRYAGEKPTAVSPRKKTQAWLDQRQRDSWTEAAYHDGERFFIPAENVEACIADGAKRSRMKNDFAWGVAVVEERPPLLIPNGKGWQPATGPLESYYRPEYIDRRAARIKMARIEVSRPKFRQWAIAFTVLLDESIVTKDQLRAALERNALGDFRPRFGRFQVAKFEVSA